MGGGKGKEGNSAEGEGRGEWKCLHSDFKVKEQSERREKGLKSRELRSVNE